MLFVHKNYKIYIICKYNFRPSVTDTAARAAAAADAIANFFIVEFKKNTGAGFTRGLRLRLSQGLKSESFVFAKSRT